METVTRCWAPNTGSGVRGEGLRAPPTASVGNGCRLGESNSVPGVVAVKGVWTDIPAVATVPNVVGRDFGLIIAARTWGGRGMPCMSAIVLLVIREVGAMTIDGVILGRLSAGVILVARISAGTTSAGLG